jgi:hypothetical protein
MPAEHPHWIIRRLPPAGTGRARTMAGDVATAGGQDVFVGNYTTNASNQTCGVGAETSFTVK